MIAEPTTLLTDYALAGVTAWLAGSLFRTGEGQRSRALWSLAFAALALARRWAERGTIRPGLRADCRILVWKATVLCVESRASACLPAPRSPPPRATQGKRWLAIAAAKLASIQLDGRHSEYIYDDRGHGTALVLIARCPLVAARDAPRAGSSRSRRLRARCRRPGKRFALHRHFNHNDLYHVIQIAAMILLYAGADACATLAASWGSISFSLSLSCG